MGSLFVEFECPPPCPINSSDPIGYADNEEPLPNALRRHIRLGDPGEYNFNTKAVIWLDIGH